MLSISISTKIIKDLRSSQSRSLSTHTSSHTSHKQLLTKITSSLNLNSQQDLYSLTPLTLRKHGGSELLQQYNNVPTLLSTFYPEFEWLPWQFTKCPDNYWDIVKNQKKFMDWAGKQLGIKEMNDWYKVTQQKLGEIGGISVLLKYNNSLTNLLSNVYPEIDWLPWKFNKCPQHFWNDEKNQRKFMDWAGKELGLNNVNDWNKINNKDFIRIGGETLLTKYDRSLPRLLSQMFPQIQWKQNVDNPREFLNTIAEKLNIKNMNDWYKITQKDFYAIEGGNILKSKYNGSVSLLLSTAYPEYEWLPWKFAQTPKSFWSDNKNKKMFLDWAGKQLGIKNYVDWYNVSTQNLVKLGGITLLYKYESLPQLLSVVYPEYPWKPFEFKAIHSINWNEILQDKEMKHAFVKHLELQLGIKEKDEWNTVLQSKLRGIKLPPNWRLSDVVALVGQVYDSGSVKGIYHKKSQNALKTIASTILPGELLEDYRHPDIKTAAGTLLELDLYFPQQKIAFEYQGKQHYRKMNYLSNTISLEERQEADVNKRDLCKANGITLVEVPYWWDKKSSSLEATICNHRPELFAVRPSGQPIPTSKPIVSQNSREMATNTLMLATEWDATTMDPTGWTMTEKYDGMRLYWNGSDFYSRQGNKVKVPEFIQSQMPAFALDAELWTRYGLYQDAVALSNNQDMQRWEKATIWVFDKPSMSNNPFEERITHLKEMKNQGKLPSFVNIVETVKCTGKQHLKEYFGSVVAKGGEGVMLRDPQSLYKAGRSPSMRKYKPFQDTEVKVIENNYPHGFNCVQLNSNKIFVGLSDNYEEAKKVKQGDVITVKHLGANIHGTLQFPKFYRARTDVKWENLIKT